MLFGREGFQQLLSRVNMKSAWRKYEVQTSFYTCCSFYNEQSNSRNLNLLRNSSTDSTDESLQRWFYRWKLIAQSILTPLVSQLIFNCNRKQNWSHTKFPLILLPNNKRRILRILDFHIVHDVFIERNHSVNTRWCKYFYKVQIPSVQQANSFLL